MHPLLASLLLLTSGPSTLPVQPDAELTAAEQLLREAKLPTDGASLLNFFRQRTPPETASADLAAAIRDLRSSSFRARERAAQQLMRAGWSARPFLCRASKDSDPEVARRAEQILRAIQQAANPALEAAAARLLAVRRPPGAAAALLAFLPADEDEVVQNALLDALTVVGVNGGKAAPALVKALTDKDPLRRATAASLLAALVPAQRPAVRRLLGDAKVSVRWQAAMSLVRAGDKSAMPALIALLEDAPAAQAWQAETLLCRVAGEKRVPAALSADDAASRRRCRQAWETWWKATGATFTLLPVAADEPLLGLSLIAEGPGYRAGRGPAWRGRIWACRRDGKILWQFEAHWPRDVRLLPRGRILVAENNPHRVTERDQRGKILWEHKLPDEVFCCQRLANGNTFIATRSEVREVTRAGMVVSSCKLKVPIIDSARRLPNGHVLCTSLYGITEFDAKGKEVRQVRLSEGPGESHLELLPTGNYLVALWNAETVVEVDPSGKVLWQAQVPKPMSATRLPNGNILVACAMENKVVELDRNGKEVWTLPTKGWACCIRHY